MTPPTITINASVIIKQTDRDRTRTCNPQIRSLVPYPLGHTANYEKYHIAKMIGRSDWFDGIKNVFLSER